MSATGYNLINIVLKKDHLSESDLRKDDISTLVHQPTPVKDKWKESMVNEIIKVHCNAIDLEGVQIN